MRGAFLAPLAPIFRLAEYCQGARFGFRRPYECRSSGHTSGRLHQMPKTHPALAANFASLLISLAGGGRKLLLAEPRRIRRIRSLGLPLHRQLRSPTPTLHSNSWHLLLLLFFVAKNSPPLSNSNSALQLKLLTPTIKIYCNF